MGGRLCLNSRSRGLGATTSLRQHHNYGNCNLINGRCNPPGSCVALDEPPSHRRR